MALGLPCLKAAPQAYNLFSGSFAGGKGPAWMTVTLQGDNTSGNTQEWTFERAELSWSASRQNYSANVLDDLLRIQRFKVGNIPQVVQFVYQIPKAVLELDRVDTTLSVTFKTSANVIVGPVSNSETNVDIRTRREQNWERFSEIPRPESNVTTSDYQQTVVAYLPGNYLTFDYYGAGLFAHLGMAANMGNIQVMLDGNIVTPALDLYPKNIPSTAFNFDPPRTDYIKTRLIDTGKKNANHRLTLSILPTSNPKSSGHILALTAFNIERYYNEGSIINEYYVQTTSGNLILYSKPSTLDGQALLGQLSFGSNLSSLLASLSGNNSGNTTAGNTSGNTIGGNTTGNIVSKPLVFPSHDVNVNANIDNSEIFENESLQRKSEAARQSQLLPTGSTVIVDLDNGQNKSSYLYDSLAGQSLELSDLDKIHHVQIQVATSLGQTSSVNGLYIVALSQPKPWPAGQSSLNFNDQGQSLLLTRNDSSSAWEVGVIEAAGILSPSGKKVLVVQSPGLYKNLDFQVSSTYELKALTGEGNATDSSSLSLKKSNFVELNAPTVPISANSNTATAAPSGGGGGGCLLH